MLLNEKIAELKRKSRTLSAEQAAVLAALNLSYELLTERELLAQDRQQIAERLTQLQAHLQVVLNEVKDLEIKIECANDLQLRQKQVSTPQTNVTRVLDEATTKVTLA